MSYQAQTWAAAQRTGSPGRKAVLMTLANMADHENACWPSQAYLAEVTELGERTVRRHLGELVAAGLLTRTKRGTVDGRVSDLYVLPVRVLADASHRPPQPVETPVAQPANLAASATGQSGRLPDIEQPATVAGSATGQSGRLPDLLAQEPLEGLQLANLAGCATGQSGRETLKDLTTTTTTTTSAKTPKPEPVTSTSDPRFVAFWSAYPRKVKKAETLRKFDIAVRKGADPELIARAAAAYARQRAEEDPQFTLHPSTWLHGGCWEDEGLLAPADPRERRDGESFEQFKARMAELRQASGQ